MRKIKVHEKALAHLSRGIYRSPGSALRELVSNAWDADARQVSISTGYPGFYLLSVDDDGVGFTKTEFEEMMEGGIGNSTKRPASRALLNDRPLIGRLGIGLLGIAQICGSFVITSYPKKGEGFRARIKLYDLLKEDLDKEEIVHKVRDVGEYEFEELEAEPAKRGTQIIADDVHPTFVRSFQESVGDSSFEEPPRKWKDGLTEVVSKSDSLQQLGDYWRLLWELSVACPLPYVDAAALPEGLIAEEQKRLERYDFSLRVDGIELFKPVWLKGHKEGYTCHKIPLTEEKVYGKSLVFHGYIVVQEGRQLRPDELRGILIRVRNIGVGYYDSSFLDYRVNQGPRSRWVTGEIFVDEGLEDALNIDRDSFNRFHPEFRAVQRELHEVLQKRIFPTVYRKLDQRSKNRAASQRSRRLEDLAAVLAEELESGVTVEERQKSEGGEASLDVSLVKRRRSTELTLPRFDGIKTKKPYRQLAASILAIYDVTKQEKGGARRRERFSKLLLELLRKW